MEDLWVIWKSCIYLVLLHVFHIVRSSIVIVSIVLFINCNIKFIHFLHNLVHFRWFRRRVDHSWVDSMHIVISFILRTQCFVQPNWNEVWIRIAIIDIHFKINSLSISIDLSYWNFLNLKYLSFSLEQVDKNVYYIL